MAVLHGYRRPLLWQVAGTAMLSSHARTPVYLNLGHILCGRCCCGADGLQVGRRQRRDPLQRSTPRERREGAVEGAADVLGSEDPSRTGATVEEQPTPEAGSRLSKLRHLRADRRPGVYEHLDRDGGRHRDTCGSARRHRDCHARWSAGAWGACQRGSVHDLSSRSRNAFDSDVGTGFKRRHRVYLAGGHFPHPAAFAAVSHSARQTTLAHSRQAPTAGGRRGR